MKEGKGMHVQHEGPNRKCNFSTSGVTRVQGQLKEEPSSGSFSVDRTSGYTSSDGKKVRLIHGLASNASSFGTSLGIKAFSGVSCKSSRKLLSHSCPELSVTAGACHILCELEVGSVSSKPAPRKMVRT